MDMKKKQIISIISIILSILALGTIIKLNMIPFKYLIIIILVLGIFLLLGNYLFYRKKRIAKVFGIILLLGLIIGNTLIIYHIGNMNHFIDQSFKEKKQERIKYYVVALEKNNLKKKDISGDLGYYEKSINVKEGIKVLEKKYEINDLKFDDINNMFNKLDQEEMKFILIEKSSFNILMELDSNRDENQYDIILEFEITKDLKTETSTEEEKFNIYVGGTDYVGLMDFNTIITVNTTTHKLLLTSIPRDYYVDVHGLNYKNKLSFITEGIDVSSNTIADLFDTKMDYYIKIDSDSVVKLINEIGGIEYCSDYEYNGSYRIVENGRRKTGSYSIKKGCQHLNGYQAIAASRTRNSFNGRDRVRQQNMQKIMIAILQKLSSTENIKNYEVILGDLSDSYETNISKKIVTKNVKDMLNNGNKWTIETQSVDGEDGQDTVHRFNDITDWVMYPNEETVENASKRIKEVLKEK